MSVLLGPQYCQTCRSSGKFCFFFKCPDCKGTGMKPNYDPGPRPSVTLMKEYFPNKVASNDALLDLLMYIEYDTDNNFIEVLYDEIEENGLTFGEREIISKVANRCLLESEEVKQ